MSILLHIWIAGKPEFQIVFYCCLLPFFASSFCLSGGIIQTDNVLCYGIWTVKDIVHSSEQHLKHTFLNFSYLCWENSHFKKFYLKKIDFIHLKPQQNYLLSEINSLTNKSHRLVACACTDIQHFHRFNNKLEPSRTEPLWMCLSI